MKPSDKIIIEDQQRIILMQARELAKIPLLIARIEALERELERLKTKNMARVLNLSLAILA